MVYVCSVAQSRRTLCQPMDSTTSGSSVHEILQERLLELVAISFSFCLISILISMNIFVSIIMIEFTLCFFIVHVKNG